MELIRIYECFCDRTRLRILHLLGQGPLCVCHLQAVLGEPQVKVSKHLAYLKNRGLVEASREANWMIYQLPAQPPRELTANLACLQDCAGEDPIFQRDVTRLRKVLPKSRYARAKPDRCECGSELLSRQSPATADARNDRGRIACKQAPTVATRRTDRADALSVPIRAIRG
jgi:ArsR family transcriptional regulator